MQKFQGGYIIGTIDGAFFMKDENVPFGEVKVSPLNIGKIEVNDIVQVNGNAYIAASKGLFKIYPDLEVKRLKEYSSITSMEQAREEKDRLYLGLGDQRVVYGHLTTEGWEKEGDIITLEHKIYSLLEDPKGRLWASWDGISRITFPNGNLQNPQVLTLDSTHGLTEEMGLIEVSLLNGEVAFGTEAGIYRWDDATQRLRPDTRYGEKFANGHYSAYNLTETMAGDVWVTSGFTTGILRKQPDDSYVYDSLPVIRAPISDYFSIYEDPDGIVWLGGTEALLRYDPKIEKDYHLPYHCLVRGVTVNNDSVIFHGTFSDGEGRIVTQQPDSYIPSLDYSLNHLTFNYAAPFFDAPEKIEYSHQLLGLEDKWTPWSPKTECEYTNLTEGVYTFRVKARNVYGTISEIAEYKFEIFSPWYRSTAAYIVYVILGLLGIYGIVRLRTRALRAAKRRLEGVVKERTEEIRVQMDLLAEQKEVITQEKEKSENLLLNILPKETSEELKAHGFARPKQFDSVSVLFTDFKGFTMIAEKLSPKQLVDEIHHCFSAFDKIAARYGIEKIKTIGDAYMAAGGLPTANDSHPLDVVRAALDIRDFMLQYKKEREAEGKVAFEIRLGVHTGPVVAGIVGLNKFQYDIWGDAVNLAARMESSGEVGKVNISQATYDLVHEHFECTGRGKIKAKNKGEINMFFAERKPNSDPNNAAH